MLVGKETPLQKKLSDIGREGEEREATRRAKRAGLPYADLRKVPVSIEAVKLIPEALAKEALVAALELKLQDVALAVFDPAQTAAKHVIEDLEHRKYKVNLFVVSHAGLKGVWHYYQFIPPEAKQITGKMELGNLNELVKKLVGVGTVTTALETTNFETTTTTALFEIILAGALANKASDMHLEAGEHETKIRYRLDGVLYDIFTKLPHKNYEGLISRIKLLSGLKINVRGEAQDGRFTIKTDHKEVEIRVSVIPSEFGETIVMRILDPDAIAVDLSMLGLRPDDLDIATRTLVKPNGLILNTGPTGSGKTTTLYAFLKFITNPEIKVITIEDPIEYRVEGVEQTQVDPQAKYTFASGLRAILRQDPDVILVGEVRDKETADIAMQASLTGHLVFSTLHTNDAVGAVPRLVDLGVKTQTIGPALSLVIAQRLVRRLCEACRDWEDENKADMEKIQKFLKKLPARVDRAPFEKIRMYKPVGCNKCNKTGYRGRVGIFEFLEVTPELGEIILKEPSEKVLKNFAAKQGMVTMQEDGILKALVGATSLDEVQKVTGPLEWA